MQSSCPQLSRQKREDTREIEEADVVDLIFRVTDQIRRAVGIDLNCGLFITQRYEVVLVCVRMYCHKYKFRWQIARED